MLRPTVGKKYGRIDESHRNAGADPGAGAIGWLYIGRAVAADNIAGADFIDDVLADVQIARRVLLHLGLIDLDLVPLRQGAKDVLRAGAGRKRHVNALQHISGGAAAVFTEVFGMNPHNLGENNVKIYAIVGDKDYAGASDFIYGSKQRSSFQVEANPFSSGHTPACMPASHAAPSAVVSKTSGR